LESKLKLVVPEYVDMDEFDFNGLVTLLRVDINSPINPENGRILDEARIKSHVPTINILLSQGAKIVLLAHQGQKGSADFVSLRNHVPVLSERLGVDVQFVPKVYGPEVSDAIKSLKNGDVLLLENTRFVDDEVKNVSMEKHAESDLVKSISALSDVYINDAFAAAHRNHASLVGFPFVLPSFAGALMVKELTALTRILKSSLRPTVFLIGGGKLVDSMKMIGNILRLGVVDKMVLTGLVGNVFLMAKGYKLGDKMVSYIQEKGYSNQLSQARQILEKYDDKILLPVDVGVLRNNERKEVDVGEVLSDDEVMDIGVNTLSKIAQELRGYKTAFVRGPSGVIEKQGFEKGTVGLMRLLFDLNIYTVIGGGHTRIIAEQLGLTDKLGYASTGGGALLTFLSGEPLPAVQALSLAVRRTRKRIEERSG
jgi:phosphoglycerate kinase